MIVRLGDEDFRLLPQRAAYWPSERVLALGDLHFGKAATFRAHGIPVPSGTTRENLQALDRLLASYAISRVVFLGDFLHARTARTPATLAALRQWRASHEALELVLVRGNHDAHAGDPPEDLNIRCVSEPYRMAGIAFCHHPQEVADCHAIAAHLHPVFSLRAGGDAVRLPCFVIGPRSTIIPSFGAFTGGMNVVRRAGQRVMVATDDRVFEIP